MLRPTWSTVMGWGYLNFYKFLQIVPNLAPLCPRDANYFHNVAFLPSNTLMPGTLLSRYRVWTQDAFIRTSCLAPLLTELPKIYIHYCSLGRNSLLSAYRGMIKFSIPHVAGQGSDHGRNLCSPTPWAQTSPLSV